MFSEIIFAGTIFAAYFFLRNPRKKYNARGTHYALQTECGDVPTLSTRAKVTIQEKGGEKLVLQRDKDKYTVPIFKPVYLGFGEMIVTFKRGDTVGTFTVASTDYVDIIALHDKWKENIEAARKALPPLEILEE